VYPPPPTFPIIQEGEGEQEVDIDEKEVIEMINKLNILLPRVQHTPQYTTTPTTTITTTRTPPLTTTTTRYLNEQYFEKDNDTNHHIDFITGNKTSPPMTNLVTIP